MGRTAKNNSKTNNNKVSDTDTLKTQQLDTESQYINFEFILYVPGVHKSDIDALDSIFDRKFTEELDIISYKTEVKNTIQIPTSFVKVEKWIPNTDLICLNCTCSHSNIPLFITEDIIIQDGERHYIPRQGLFCSINCAYEEICKSYKEPVRSEKIYFLKQVNKLINDKDISIIQNPPNKVIMKKFCGTIGITEDEYQKMISKLV